MGKAIVIKGADFSAESVGQVSFLKKEWACGVGDKMAQIISDLKAETTLTKDSIWFFGPTSPLSFSGKTITKIAVRLKQQNYSYFVVYGIIDKTANTAQACADSYEEKGYISVDYNAAGSIINIPPLQVPEGKTIAFTLRQASDGYIRIDPDVIQGGKSYGVPGLDRYFNNAYSTFATTRLFIDFLTEEPE